MIKTAVKYSKLSNGAFDITIGPIIKLWGIGTDNEIVPTDEEIKSKLSLVGYNNISIKESVNVIPWSEATWYDILIFSGV